ncbi:MAG TPA: glycosyltransferase family 2 protein [Gemmatimonadaceae bacterium]|nr:glycosyltransferase family 2 protein [Gemmatimonadaceae bacterium]
MTVDIICAVFDGAQYLPEFLASLRAQTYADWRLWLRDDGSSDESPALLRREAAQDDRIRLLEHDSPRLGAARSFDWLLARTPADAHYVMCADQDDVWLPRKIEGTLHAMRRAEAETPGAPVLVHTDLTVVDAVLRPVHPSFWTYAGMDPEPATLRRFIVRNVTTGATLMLNAPLRVLAADAPPEMLFHDWWYACVAASFGRIVALREPTVLYRQHGGNAVGARNGRLTLDRVPRGVAAGVRNAREFRRGLRQTAAQARAFLDRFGDRLSESDREFLKAYSEIPYQRFVRRKLDLLRFRALPEHGLVRRLGVLLRG